MYTNATSIACFVNNVMELLNRIGYDVELCLLSSGEDLTAWTVGLELAVQGSEPPHRRYRFSFRATPCTSAGNAADITDLDCTIVGPLHGEKHLVFERVAAAHAAMMEALGDPEAGSTIVCGFDELAKALTWAMVDAGEETVITRFMR